MSGSDFRPTANWDRLRLRAALLQRLRRFFDDRGFLEVETPILSHDTVVDRHLDPLAVILPDDPRFPQEGRRLWLQTSPEFGMKRLLAAGCPSIYQITRVFRASEQGRLHNPEFTMVEWYETGASYQAGMQLLAELIESTLELPLTQQITYQAAFKRYRTIDPHTAPTAQLQQTAHAQGIDVSSSFAADDRDVWLNLLLSQCIEPQLGRGAATILCDYPAAQAALAQLHGDPPVAQRFELYVHGIELANGYHELTDADVLRRRQRENNTQRRQDGKPELPENSRLLAAMDYGLPVCTGVALGFDRLVMLAAGAESLADVMAFPIDRA